MVLDAGAPLCAKKTFYSYSRWYMAFHTKYVKTCEGAGRTF